MNDLPLFTTHEALGAHLRQVQAQRLPLAAVRLGPPLAAACSTHRLREMTDMLLPLVQTRSGYVRRERDGSWLIRLTLHYREGVRLADAWAAGTSDALPPREKEALDRALLLTRPCLTLPEEARARYLLDIAARQAVYDNPARGCAACGPVLGAVGVLQTGRANCQGYSDLLLVLATLSGLTATCQAGWKHREAHVWNLLRIGGRWMAADVTSGRLGRTQAECATMGLRWERWAEMAPLPEA